MQGKFQKFVISQGYAPPKGDAKKGMYRDCYLAFKKHLARLKDNKQEDEATATITNTQSANQPTNTQTTEATMQAEPAVTVYDSIAPYSAKEVTEITAKTVANMPLEEARLTILRLLKNVEKSRLAAEEAQKAETLAMRELAIWKDAYNDIKQHEDADLAHYSKHFDKVPLPKKAVW